jgi:hypothetical protein
MIEEGRFYLSSTEINGRRCLRMVLVNPETSLEDIQDLATSIRRIAQAVGPEPAKPGGRPPE